MKWSKRLKTRWKISVISHRFSEPSERIFDPFKCLKASNCSGVLPLGKKGLSADASSWLLKLADAFNLRFQLLGEIGSQFLRIANQEM